MASADFKLVPLLPITRAKLVGSSAPAQALPEYFASAVYAAGDIRGITSSGVQDAYQSLQAENVGNAPATSPAWWKPLGRVSTYLSNGSYAVDAVVVDQLNQLVYQSLIANNTGKALTDKNSWLPLGSTNTWRMFDKVVNTQTLAPDFITVQVSPGELCNTITLLNVTGPSVTVEQTQSGYKRTRSLVKHNKLSWYDWFYDEPLWISDVVFDDIPPYPNAMLTVTVSSPGGQAGVGCCFFGKARIIGTTQWGLTAGIFSYSGSETDKFGNMTLVKRDSAKRMNFEVSIPQGYEDEAYRILRDYTDVEIVAIATTEYALALSYGTLGSWEVPVAIDGKLMPIEWRGLI